MSTIIFYYALRKTFFHYWDQWLYGRSFFTGAGIHTAAVQYLSKEENTKRIGLAGENFVDMLRSTETVEDWTRKWLLDDEIIYALKEQIREQYIIEQKKFFKLLEESGLSLSAVASHAGTKVVNILT